MISNSFGYLVRTHHEGQVLAAIPADASPLLEEAETLLPPPLPLVVAGEESTGALTGHVVGDYLGITWDLGAIVLGKTPCGVRHNVDQ